MASTIIDVAQHLLALVDVEVVSVYIAVSAAFCCILQ